MVGKQVTRVIICTQLVCPSKGSAKLVLLCFKGSAEYEFANIVWEIKKHRAKKRRRVSLARRENPDTKPSREVGADSRMTSMSQTLRKSRSI